MKPAAPSLPLRPLLPGSKHGAPQSQATSEAREEAAARTPPSSPSAPKSAPKSTPKEPTRSQASPTPATDSLITHAVTRSSTPFLIMNFLALALVVGLAGVLIWNLIADRNQTLDIAALRSQHQAQAFADHASRTLAAVEMSLLDIADRISGRLYDDRYSPLLFHRNLQDRSIYLPQVNELRVYDSDGLLEADSHSFPAKDLNVEGTAFFRDHRDRWLSFVIQPPATEGAAPQAGIPAPFIAMSRAVLDENGRFAGVVQALINPAFFKRFYATDKSTHFDAIALIQPDGQILAHWSHQPAVASGAERETSSAPPRPRPTTTTAIPDSIRFEASDPILARGGLHTVVREGVITTLYQLPDYPLRLVIALHQSQVLRDWHQDALLVGSVLTLVLLGSGALFIVAFRQAHRRALMEEEVRLMSRAVAASSSGIMIIDKCPKEAKTGFRFKLPKAKTTAPPRPHPGPAESEAPSVTSPPGASPGDGASQGEIVFVNPAFEQITGYKARDVIGMGPLDILCGRTSARNASTAAEKPDGVQQIKRLLTGTTAQGEPQEMAMVLRSQRSDGSDFWNDIRLAPITNPQGQVTHFVAVMLDVTHRIAAERALIERTGDLERSNAELERFAYVASHDLQEPLRMVSSYLQLLKRRYATQLGSDAEEFIRYAVDGAQRMKRLIQDLLEFSRLNTRAQPFETFPLARILEEALTNLHHAIHDAQARVTWPDALPVIKGDDAQLVRLLQNLIGNALKYRASDRHPEIRIELVAKDQRWVLAVHDNGIGIDPDYYERIFVIFQRLHPPDRYSGTGIGLAIARKIVERHGGRIWVDSSPGQGSSFYFSLPRLTNGESGLHPATISLPPPPSELEADQDLPAVPGIPPCPAANSDGIPSMDRTRATANSERTAAVRDGTFA